MTRTAPLIKFPWLRVKRGNKSLHLQIAQCIHDAVMGGLLKSGARLPSTRALSIELKVARLTVVRAYKGLEVAGIIEADGSSGSRISHKMPQAPAIYSREDNERSKLPKIRRRELLLGAAHNDDISPSRPMPFAHGIGAREIFPFDNWARMHAKVWRLGSWKDLDYSSSFGHLGLREEIAKYVGRNRGVKCSAQQVLICTGAQQAFDLCARVLLTSKDTVWIEEPGYHGARWAFSMSTSNFRGLEIDGEGAKVPSRGTPRLVYLTPAHQYPLAVTMSVARRYEWVEAARKRKFFIIEDDYDGEFSYEGEFLGALRSCDLSGRTLYVGTFSKSLWPALRIGYVVLPDELIQPFSIAKLASDRHGASMEHEVLYRFMADGGYDRHLWRARALYRERRDTLCSSIKENLNGVLNIVIPSSGIHTIATMENQDQSVEKLEKKASSLNLSLTSLKRFGKSAPSGFIFGFAAFPEKVIEEAVQRLKKLF
jgi:GntR family transcriptional regulator/MocR family aminotransferase